MTPKWLTIEKALLSLAVKDGSEFAAKYLENRYRIHTPESIEGFIQDVAGLLRTKLDEKRLIHAMKVLRFLLVENDMEDWASFTELLTAKEIKGGFWKKYRDHSIHQVLSFLLGSFLYKHCPILQERFAIEYSCGECAGADIHRTGFYYQWSTAALLHDFGYYLDVEKGFRDEEAKTRAAVLETFFQSVDEYLRNYIFIVFSHGGHAALSADETRALTVLRDLLGHSDIEHDYQRKEDFQLLGKFVGQPSVARGNQDAWDLLDTFARKRDPRFGGVFSAYFRILATQGAPYGDNPIPIWDHGIASAIFFLKLSTFCWSYFESVRTLADVHKKFRIAAGPIAEEITERIKRWDYSEGAFWGSFVESCFAMALHNLRDFSRLNGFETAGYTSEDERLLRRIGTDVLPIKISDGVVAFLLMLVDQLQDWDRYPIIRTGSIDVLDLLEAADVQVRCESGRVIFRFAKNKSARRDAIRNDLERLVFGWKDIINIE